MKKKTLLPLFIFTLLLTMVACGYPSPSGGGSFTPYVSVVTPTPLPGTATAYADATVLARYTPTALPLTFVAPPPTSAVTNQPGTTGPQPSPTPTLAVQGDEYTIQQGDTLLGIAIRFNVDFEELASSNNITDRNNIKVGQKLKLPKRKVGTPGAAATATPLG